MKLTITAEIIDSVSNDQGEFEAVTVLVIGHNLSEELVGALAKQAFSIEAGWDLSDVERSISDWDIVSHGPVESKVTLSF